MASIHKRKSSSFWSGFWRDALGHPHHRSTKIRIVPKGITDVGERNRWIALNKQKAQALVDKWERDDKGDAVPVQDQKVTAEIADRKLPGQNLKNVPSRMEFAVTYLIRLLDMIGGNTAGAYLGHLKAWLIFEGKRAALAVSTLTPEQVKAYKMYEKRLGHAETTVNQRLRFLRSMFESGVGAYFKTNPANGLIDAAVANSRRPLEANEIRKLLSSALAYEFGRQWVTAILFALYLGMRMSDAVRVRWSMINMEEQFMDFTQFKLRKYKKELRVPLHDELYRWLLYIKPESPQGDAITPQLIDRPPSCLTTSFNRIVELAGIDFGAQELDSGITTRKVVFHCLRHTVVTWLDDLCVPDSHRMELVGHASRRTHSIYSHTRLRGLRRTVAKLQDVATGVLPLAEMTQPLPTSTELLSDSLQAQFRRMHELLGSPHPNAKALQEQLNIIQCEAISVIHRYETAES